jgi:secreted trypsin-like serine protease
MGDSGSPLTFAEKLIGIVSWGESITKVFPLKNDTQKYLPGVPCARNFPDVYARVDAHKDWILKNMN